MVVVEEKQHITCCRITRWYQPKARLCAQCERVLED